MGWEDEIDGDGPQEDDAHFEAETRNFEDELLAEVAAGRGDLSLLQYQLDRYRTRAVMAGVAGLLGAVGAVACVVALVAGFRLKTGLQMLAVTGIITVFGLGGMVKLLSSRRRLKGKLAAAEARR